MMSASESSNVSNPFQKERTMLILVGLIASGKSTFANALEHHFPSFRRCSQDDLGSRQRVEELAYYTLREGGSPCIDRTNFNAVQRSCWTSIAHAFPATSVSVIVFDTPYHVCASRLQRRTAHPTIRDAQHGMAVLQKFASDFQMPLPGEGYDHIIYVRPEDHPQPQYTREDVLSILERLKASTRESGSSVMQRSNVIYFGQSKAYSRPGQAHGLRGNDHWRPCSPARGTSYGSRSIGRDKGSNNSSWRRPGTNGATNRETSNHQPAGAANVPPMEGSKGRDSAEERHNSS